MNIIDSYGGALVAIILSFIVAIKGTSKVRMHYGYFNPVMAFLLLYSVYILFGHAVIALYHLTGVNAPLFDSLIDMDERYFETTALICMVLVGFSVGVRLVKSPAGLNKIKSFKLNGSKEKLLKYSLYLTLIASILSLVYFFSNYGFSALNEDADDARYSMIEQGGFKYIFFSFMYTTPFVGAIGLHKYLVTGRSSWLIIYGVAALIQISSVLTAFRTFLIVFILISLSVYAIKHKVSARLAFRWMGFGVLLIILITIVKYKAFVFDQPEYIVFKLLHRLVFDGYYSLKIVVETFSRIDYLFGESYYWDLYAKLPGQQMTFQNFLGEQVGAGRNMALAPTLPGELYANYGYAGGFVIAIIFGYILTNISNYYFNKTKMGNDFAIIGYALCTMFASRSVEVGFGGVYFLVVVVSLLFSFLLVIRMIIYDMRT